MSPHGTPRTLGRPCRLPLEPEMARKVCTLLVTARTSRAAVFAALLCAGSACATTSAQLAFDPLPERQAPRLADSTLATLAWMAGCWGSTQEGVEMEELWTAPKGGMLLGLHRDVFPSGRVFFEFLRIESRPDGVFYVAQPRGVPPTSFRLVESGDRRAAFANPDHDFPQRIVYWLDDAGVLHSRIEGEEDGGARSAAWAWPRVPCDSNSEA